MSKPLTIEQAIAKLAVEAEKHYIQDVADAAGLCAGTVRRALALSAHGEPQMQVKTLLALAESLGFTLKVVLEA